MALPTSLEQQLRETEERYRLTFEHASVGIAIADTSKRFKRVNRRFAAMLGYDADELLDKSVTEVSHPDDIHVADDHMRRLISGQSVREEYDRRYIRKDGRVVWAHVTVSAARRDDGSLAFMIGVVEDVTELRSARFKQAALARLGSIALGRSGLGFLFARSAEAVGDLLHADVVDVQKASGDRLLTVGSTRGALDAEAAENDLARDCFDQGVSVRAERADGTRFTIEGESDPGMVSGVSLLIDTVDVPKWGVLSLRSSEAQPMNAADVDFLRALTALLAQAIERRRTEVELRIRAVQQSAIAELGRLTSDRVSQATLERACELVMEGLGLEQASILVPSNGGFRVAAGTPQRTCLEATGTHAGEAFAELKPLIFDKTSSVRRFSAPAETCAGMAVPVATRDTRFGVVAAYTTAPKHFTASDVAFVESVATVIAEAMQRDAARAALVESERRFRSVVEGASEIIFSVSPTGEILALNPAFEAITGWRAEEWIGRSFIDLFVEEERADKIALFESVLAEPRHIRLQSRVMGRSGVVLLDLATSPKVVNGVVLELYGFARDVTEERRLETKLEQANRLAGLGRLAATVAHEFNNVLMGIAPFTEILRREVGSERASAAVDQISRSVKRGKRITEDILRFAQPAEPLVTTVEIAPWLRALATEMRTMIGAKYTIDVEADDLRVAADPNQLHQALLNLILNARDAMPQGGEIAIAARTEPPDARFAFGAIESPQRFAHFTVADRGEGIGEDVLEHIFEPLFTTKKTGTGLGLPVAMQVVSRHGGEMFVESEVGRGTTFHLFIPLASFAEPAETIAAQSEGRRYRKILLVEDEGAVAAGIAALLDSEGIEVAVVGTGAEVLPSVERLRPDAVVLDIGLPDVDGITVFRSLSSAYPDLPVVFSSGHGDAARLDRYLAMPHVGFLLKPYDIDSLLRMLDRVTAKRRDTAT